mgnify:CR=1 FL=1
MYGDEEIQVFVHGEVATMKKISNRPIVTRYNPASNGLNRKQSKYNGTKSEILSLAQKVKLAAAEGNWAFVNRFANLCATRIGR